MNNQNLYKNTAILINKPSYSMPKFYRPMKSIKINTPLQVIQTYFDKIINKDFETAKTIFIDNEMSLYTVNDNKETILHYILRICSEKNETEDNILTIINNVDNIWNLLSIKNKFNQTPFHLMCMYQLYKVYNSIPNEYKELIDYNLSDSYGRTPYMYTIIGKKITESLSKIILTYLLNVELDEEKINKHKVEYYTALTLIKNNNILNEETKKENFEQIKNAINSLISITEKNSFDIPGVGKIYKIKDKTQIKYFLKNVYRNNNTLDYYYYVPEFKLELEKKVPIDDKLKDEYHNSINDYKNANILSNIISVEEKDNNPIIKFVKNIHLSNGFNKKVEEQKKLLKGEKLEKFKENEQSFNKNNKNINNYIYYDALFVPLIDNYLEKYIDKTVCMSINELVNKQLESDKLSDIKDYDKIDFSIFCKNFNEIEYNSFHIINYVKSILTLMDFYNNKISLFKTNSKGIKEWAYNILLQSLNVIRYLKTECNKLKIQTKIDSEPSFEPSFEPSSEPSSEPSFEPSSEPTERINNLFETINSNIDETIKLFTISIQNKTENDTLNETLHKTIIKFNNNIELFKKQFEKDTNEQVNVHVNFYILKINNLLNDIIKIIKEIYDTKNNIKKIITETTKEVNKKLLEINVQVTQFILSIKSILNTYIKSYNNNSSLIIDNITNALIYFNKIKKENEEKEIPDETAINKYSIKLYQNMINTIISISELYPHILLEENVNKYIENLHILINTKISDNETIINQFNLIDKRFKFIDIKSKPESIIDNEYIIIKHLIYLKDIIKKEDTNKIIINEINEQKIKNKEESYITPIKNKLNSLKLVIKLKNNSNTSYEFIISKNIELIKDKSDKDNTVNYNEYILSQTFNNYNFIEKDTYKDKKELITNEITEDKLLKNTDNIYEYFQKIYQDKNKEIDTDYLIKQNDEILIEGSLQENINNIKNIINKFIKNIENKDVKQILNNINNDIENIISINGVNFVYNVLYEIFETLYYNNDIDKFTNKTFTEENDEINNFKLKVGNSEDENDINLFKQALINNILYHNYNNDDIINYTFYGLNKLISILINKLCFFTYNLNDRNNLGLLHLLKKDTNMRNIINIPRNIIDIINSLNGIITLFTRNGSIRVPGDPAIDVIINNNDQTFDIQYFQINSINIKIHFTDINNKVNSLNDFNKSLDILSNTIQYNIENIQKRIKEIKEIIKYINLQNILIQFIYNLKDMTDIYYINTFINNINNFDNNPIVDNTEGKEAHLTENPPIKTVDNYNNTLISLRNCINQKINIEINQDLIKQEKYNNLQNILQKYSKQLKQFDILKSEIKNNENLSKFVSSINNIIRNIQFPLLIVLSNLYDKLLVQPEIQADNIINNYNILDYLNEILNRNDFNIQRNYQEIINIIIKLINKKVNNYYSDDFVKDIIKEFIEIKQKYNIYILNGNDIDIGNNDYNNAANAIIGTINFDDFSYNKVLDEFNNYTIQNNNIQILILTKILKFILIYRLEYNPDCYKEIIQLINKMDNDYLFNLTKIPKLTLNNNVSVFLSILYKVFEKENYENINRNILQLIDPINGLDFNTKQFTNNEDKTVSIENLTVNNINTNNLVLDINPINHQYNSSDIITHIIKLSFKNRSFNELTNEDIMNIYDITQFNNIKLYHLYKNVEILDNYINNTRNSVEIQNILKDMYKEIQDKIPENIYYDNNNSINEKVSEINSIISNYQTLILLTKEQNKENIQEALYIIQSILNQEISLFYIPYIRIILDSIKNNGLSKDCFDLSEIYRRSLREIDKFIGENNVYNENIHMINEQYIYIFDKFRYYNDYEYNVNLLINLYDLTQDINIQKYISIIINILQLTNYNKFINNRLLYINDDITKEQKRIKYTSIVDCIYEQIPNINSNELNDNDYIYNLKLIENIIYNTLNINKNNQFIIPSLSIKQIYRMNNKEFLLKYIVLNKAKYLNENNPPPRPPHGGAYNIIDINRILSYNEKLPGFDFNINDIILDIPKNIIKLFDSYINSSVNNVLFLSNHTNLKPEFNNSLFKNLYYNQLLNSDYIQILLSFILSYDKFKDDILYNIYVYSVIIKYISLIKDYNKPSENKSIKFILDYINSIINDIYDKLKNIINTTDKEDNNDKIKNYIKYVNPLLNINDIDTIIDEDLTKYTIDNINKTINDIIKNLINNTFINQDINYDEIIIYLFKNLKKDIILDDFINNEQFEEINKYLYNYIELQAYINSYDLNMFSYIFNNNLINDIIKLKEFNYDNNCKSSFNKLTGGLNPYSIPIQIINTIFDSNINKYPNLLLFNNYDRIKKLILSTNIIRVIVIINLLNNDPQKIKYQKFNHYKKKIMKPLLNQLNNKFDINVQKDLFYLLDDLYINMSKIIYKIQQSYNFNI